MRVFTVIQIKKLYNPLVSYEAFVLPPRRTRAKWDAYIMNIIRPLGQGKKEPELSVPDHSPLS